MLLHSNISNWEAYGATYTAKEIGQQPKLWEEVFQYIKEKREEISTFFQHISNQHDNVQFIFTGAGTSAFVGNTILPYLKMKLPHSRIDSIPTTNIVSNPYYYFNENVPTVMISFARSGNSPESVAAVELGEQIVKEFYHITVTCNTEGKLANRKGNEQKNLTLFMPKEANDQGFAMTSSFTTMMLSALLIFHVNELEKMEPVIEKLCGEAQYVVTEGASSLYEVANKPFQRIVYLGSGVFEGLSREAALKFLELTGGNIPTMFDSSLGFRHGPKSILNEQTLVVLFVSNDSHTRKYDVDMLKEIYYEPNRGPIVVLSPMQDDEIAKYSDFYFRPSANVEGTDDVFLTFLYILYAQTFALYKSIALGIKTDNPSPTGLVNRVVQGVRIYPYNR